MLDRADIDRNFIVFFTISHQELEDLCTSSSERRLYSRSRIVHWDRFSWDGEILTTVLLRNNHLTMSYRYCKNATRVMQWIEN